MIESELFAMRKKLYGANALKSHLRSGGRRYGVLDKSRAITSPCSQAAAGLQEKEIRRVGGKVNSGWMYACFGHQQDSSVIKKGTFVRPVLPFERFARQFPPLRSGERYRLWRNSSSKNTARRPGLRWTHIEAR